MNPFAPTQRTDISLFLCLVNVHSLPEYLSFGKGQELKSYHLTWQKDRTVLNRGARGRILNNLPFSCYNGAGTEAAVSAQDTELTCRP